MSRIGGNAVGEPKAAVLLGLPTMSPTHFTAIRLRGITLDGAVSEYFDWIEGAGRYSSRRTVRAKQGVPLSFDRTAAIFGTCPNTTNGCVLDGRRNLNQALLRFIHRDHERPEIWWHSVVRLTQTTAPESDALLVEHATGRALPPHLRLPAVAGAPRVVSELCALPGVTSLARDLVSTKPLRISEADADAFVRHVLVDVNRAYPYLVVTPTKVGNEFLVDPSILAKRLAAQVVVVAVDSAATRAFAKAFVDLRFPAEFGSCFDGAARIYQTGLAANGNYRDHYLWLPDRLKALADQATDRIAGEVAERVTWRLLPPRFFALLDDWDRNEIRIRTDDLLRRDATESIAISAREQQHEPVLKALREQLRATQEERELWEREVSAQQRQIDELHQLLEVAEQERDESKHLLHSSSAQISALKSRASGQDIAVLEALRRALVGGPRTLEEALDLVETLYPDRVTALSSARSSARESVAFQSVDKAFELMLKLAHDYWPIVQEKGDTEARKCFSDKTFASRESETVESKRGAVKRRTFEYNGRQVEMMKHLKIGVKDSIAETWRLYFEFDSDSCRVVIGHCGKHLDFD